MAGAAYQVIELFWKTQDDGDYTRLVDLFAEDAIIEDPIYGTFNGKQAIGGFMAKMNEVMAGRDTRFEIERISGGDKTAWAQWVMISPDGRRNGVGVYEVADGKLTYYRDYLDPVEEA